MAEKPTVEWDEGNPSGSQEKSLGAIRMREMRTQLREIIGDDHKFDSTGQGTTWGYHNKLTFYIQASDPIPDTGTSDIYAKDDTTDSKAALFWVDAGDTVIQLTQGANFVGGMIGEVRHWKGLIADIPVGWALCDGVSNALNLVGKFIRGVDTSATEAGGTGGTDSQTLVEANLPAHTHTSSFESSHTHSVISTEGNAGAANTIINITLAAGAEYFDVVVDGGGVHTHTANAIGNGEAFDNRPAYLEEVYMIRV